MKNIFLLLLTALLFQACERTESNEGALQANIESDFFKAFSATAEMDEDNLSITIVGQSDNQEIILHTEWRGQKRYEVGMNTLSYATFKDAEGNVYSTNTEGSDGVITITNRSDIRHEVSGKFKFSCVIPGRDTIVVHKGLFYEVPFTMVDNTP